MGIVLKKGGKKKEAFSAAKIINSVERAVKDAKLAPAKFVKEIAEPTIEYFKKKKIVKTTDIRKLILREFARRSQAVVRAWKMYEKKKQALNKSVKIRINSRKPSNKTKDSKIKKLIKLAKSKLKSTKKIIKAKKKKK